jgi:hypothetical protein
VNKALRSRKFNCDAFITTPSGKSHPPQDEEDERLSISAAVLGYLSSLDC